MKMKLLVNITCIFLFVFASQSQALINFNNLIPNNSGGELYLPPLPPQTETTPNPPKLYIQWAVTDSIKLKWQDKSYVEEGFRVELLTDQGLWTVIDTYASLAGKGLTESIIIPDLFPNEEYCFRVVAHNESGDSGGLAEAVQEACTHTTIATEKSCPGSVIDDILNLATNENSEISLACDFKLQPGQLVTKRLIFEGPAASDIIVDLNRALLKALDGISYRGKDRIEVRSVETGVKDNKDISIYTPPENITIKNGNIIGSVRIWGMSKNASGEQFKLSSRTSDHTARARSNAPKNIVFDNLTITGTGRNPVYFAAGVSHSKLINSRVHGKSNAVAIYLDAESSKNTIKNNEIDVSTKNKLFESWDRPLIAIDGSSGNKIINNRFSNLSHGGIYLYRNCGEKSVIRHATPERNHIINNTFYYKKYTGANPSVYLGSHDRGWINGQSWLHSKFFCSDDDGYPYGSSVSDKDYARNNIVMQNQFFERNVAVLKRGTVGVTQLEKAEITPDYVKTSNPSLNSDNKITNNQIVTEETVDYEQPAGCYVEMENRGFIFDQESFVIHPTQCTSTRYTCNDGELVKQPILTPICAAIQPNKAVMTKPKPKPKPKAINSQAIKTFSLMSFF